MCKQWNWNLTLLYHNVVRTISSSVTIRLSHSINLVKMTISTPKCFTLFIIILVTAAATATVSSSSTAATQRTTKPRKIRKCLFLSLCVRVCLACYRTTRCYCNTQIQLTQIDWFYFSTNFEGLPPKWSKFEGMSTQYNRIDSRQFNRWHSRTTDSTVWTTENSGNPY